MKNLTKALGIAGITALSFLPMKNYGQSDLFACAGPTTIEKIKSQLGKARLDSIEMAVSEFRDIFGRPKSFLQKFYFSNNSILEIYASDICPSLKTRSITYFNKGAGEKMLILLYTGEGGEELPIEDKKGMEKYVKEIYKQTKHVPGGVTLVGK